MVSALPSKRIFLLIIACLIGIGAVSFAVFASKNGQNSKIPANDAALLAVSEKIADSTNLEMAKKALQATSAKDDDSDGLMNWEETLWGTDQKKADTDGDATKDGEEVKANRNPLKAGPDDKLATASAGGNGGAGTSANTGSAIDASTNTQTAQLSRELFANYIAAKQSGATLDPETQNAIIEQTFANKSLVAPAKTYSMSDVKISASADLKTYGNALGNAFYAGSTKTNTNEIDILQSALKNESRSEIAKLDPIIAGYSTITTQLLTVSVPATEAVAHLSLINNSSKVTSDIKSFKEIFEDPVVALVAVGTYYKDIDALRQSIKDIRTRIIQNGIVFDPAEYGYVFFR